MTNRRTDLASFYALLLLFAFLVGVVFLYQYAERVHELVRVQAEIAAWEGDIASAQQRNLELQEELAFVVSDEYVAETARAELGLIQPGDDVYVVLDDGTSEALSEGGSQPRQDEAVDSAPLNLFDWEWWQSLFR